MPQQVVHVVITMLYTVFAENILNLGPRLLESKVWAKKSVAKLQQWFNQTTIRT
jgi:hypothetical protein